jgi:hypothetical protein
MCAVSFDPADVLWYSKESGELLDITQMASS